MKVENIISNGISYNEPAQKASGDIIKTAVSLFKMRHTEEEIFDMIKENKDNLKHSYHSGSRFNDDDTITTRICSAITREAVESHLKCRSTGLEDHEALLIEGIIKSFVDSLSGSEMDTIILDGMRDCAASDHWYTFEKEWN